MASKGKTFLEIIKESFYNDENHKHAKCKDCGIIIDMNLTAMIEHKMYHDKNNKEEIVYCDIVDSGKRRAELSAYGKIHSIKLNHNGSKGYCLVCDRYLPAHITNFKEHVQGSIHIGHLELKGKRKPRNRNVVEKYETVPVKSFLKTFMYSNKMLAFWVNNEFWVDLPSLFLLRPAQNGPHYANSKCLVCDEMLTRGAAGEHFMSPKHREKLNAAKVVVADQEFIREIRPNFFHCGFCNLTFPYLETLDKHVRSIAHGLAKIEKLKQDTATKQCPINLDNNNIVKGADIYMQLLPHIFFRDIPVKNKQI